MGHLPAAIVALLLSGARCDPELMYAWRVPVGP